MVLCWVWAQLHLEDVHPSGLATPLLGRGTALEHLHPSRGRPLSQERSKCFCLARISRRLLASFQAGSVP